MCISAVALGAGFVVVITLFLLQYYFYVGKIISLPTLVIDLVGKIISLPTLVSCSVGDC